MRSLDVVLKKSTCKLHLLTGLEGRHAEKRTRRAPKSIAEIALCGEHDKESMPTKEYNYKQKIDNERQARTLPQDDLGASARCFASSCCSMAASPHEQFLQALRAAPVSQSIFGAVVAFAMSLASRRSSPSFAIRS
jgi:hypothetical protein